MIEEHADVSIQLVVTDLDGTLWETPGEIHPRTRLALAELSNRSVRLMVATARRPGGTRALMAGLGLAPPAVLLNGSIGIDLETEERFFRQAFAPLEAAAVLALFEAADLEPCVYVDHGAVEVYVGGTPATHPGHLAALGVDKSRADLREVVATVPVLAVGIVGRPSDMLGPVHAAAAGLATARLMPSPEFGGVTLVVIPRALSKWAGVAAFCHKAGIDVKAVMAVGDGPNDVELLTAAAIAVAPEDAASEALACAHHVIPGARVGGWAAILDLV